MNKMFLMYLKQNDKSDNDVSKILDTLNQEVLKENRNSYYGSLFGLFHHITEANLYFCKLYLQSLPDDVNLNKLKEIVLPPTDFSQENYKQLRINLPQIDKILIDFISSLSNDKLSTSIKIDWYKDRDSVPLHFILNQHIVHGIHHRAQISQILDELKIDNDFSGIDIEFMF